MAPTVEEKKLYIYSFYFHIEQLVNSSTRVTDSTANVLGLIQTSHADIFDRVTYLDSSSAHRVISSSIRNSVYISISPRKRILLYDKANFEEINLELNHFFQGLPIEFC